MRQSRHGFTLIELSIVLVIIGLIVGGVLVGQSLIRASKQRAVVSEMQKFTTANNTFRTKYNCIAGDCKNATTFFGTDTGGCPTGTGTGTCNGDGNNLVGIGAQENYHYWEQLALAGLIEGTYTGTSPAGGCGGTCHSVPGSNVPVSKGFGGGYTNWEMGPNGYATEDTWTFDPRPGNVVMLGSYNTNFWTYTPIMAGQDAFAIDSKIDDGSPRSGKLRPWKNASCTTTLVNTTAEYTVTGNTIGCGLIFYY